MTIQCACGTCKAANAWRSSREEETFRRWPQERLHSPTGRWRVHSKWRSNSRQPEGRSPGYQFPLMTKSPLIPRVGPGPEPLEKTCCGFLCWRALTRKGVCLPRSKCDEEQIERDM